MPLLSPESPTFFGHQSCTPGPAQNHSPLNDSNVAGSWRDPVLPSLKPAERLFRLLKHLFCECYMVAIVSSRLPAPKILIRTILQAPWQIGLLIPTPPTF